MAGEGPHPLSWKGTCWITSCSCLGSNPKSLHKAGVGAGNPLSSQSCWTLGAQHPPSLSHMVLTLFQPHCSQELSAPGLLLLPSSHPPHPTNRCQQPLLMLLAGPKDSNTISAQLLLPHCKPPCSSTFLMASVHSHGYLASPSKKENSPKWSPLTVARTSLKMQSGNLGTQQRMG